MIHFQVRHLMGVLECHQLIAVPIRTGKKKIQLSVHCHAIPITTGKKIQLSGHHSLRRSNCHCCAVPITTRKKDTVVCPLLRHSNYDQKKIATVVWPSFAALFQLPLLVVPFQIRPEQKTQSSVQCYAIPITTGKKRYSQLAIIHCAVPIAIVAPFQLRQEKRKDTVVCPLLRHSKCN